MNRDKLLSAIQAYAQSWADGKEKLFPRTEARTNLSIALDEWEGAVADRAVRKAYEDAAKMAEDTGKACLSAGCGCDPKYCSCRVVNEAVSTELESLAEELRQKAGKL